MSPSAESAEERFAALARTLFGKPGVSLGSGKRGFGSGALQVHGKVFAMVSSKGQLVVKLPRRRVDALLAAGQGERFDPGHGRLMKEWLAVGPGFEESWLRLATEALEFVSAKP